MAKPTFNDDLPLIEPDRCTDQSWTAWGCASAQRRALVNTMRDLLDAMPAANEALALLEQIDTAAGAADIAAETTVKTLNTWRLRLLNGQASTVPAQTAAAKMPEPPAYMRELLGRAADMLGTNWRAPIVKFVWWADGEECRYVGRLDWMDEGAVLLQIAEARSGRFVCQSLLGQPYEIDSINWVPDEATDEIERAEWMRGCAKACMSPKER